MDKETKYYKRLWYSFVAIILGVGGFFLLGEHYITWQGLNIGYDIIGHETLGFVMVLLGLYMFLRKNTPVKDPIKKAEEELKYYIKKYLLRK